MRSPVAAVCVSLLAGPSLAQCATSWESFGAGAGVGGVVFNEVEASVAWDPDGSGPLPERIVVGGTFTTAGSVFANCIAVCDPVTGTWSALGSGCNSTVQALAVLPNGDLVAAGLFTTAGGTPVNHIARWNGQAWLPMGGGLGGYATALLVTGNGELVAGGYFGVARWNGTAWSSGGLSNLGVLALVELPNGDLVAGGYGPGSSFPNLARWNGTAWSMFGVGALVHALAAAQNGDLFVGGSFAGIDGVLANNVARWNGTAWSPLGSGMTAALGGPAVYSLRVLASGDVVAGGWFPMAGGSPAACIARWNGSAWSPLGLGMRGASFVWPSSWTSTRTVVKTLATRANGALIAGGNFSVAGTSGAQNVASWDGAQWSALSAGPGLGAVNDLVAMPGGDVVAVGGFAAAGTLATNGVARWNGTAWSSLGGSGTNVGGVVLAAARMPNGDLVVGGVFSSIGGVPAANIARWNGSQWLAMGSLPGAVVRALAVSPTGTVYVGGSFYPSSQQGVFAWNGTSWNAVNGVLADVYALAFLPDGRLVAGGFFTPSNIAVWNGTTWSQLGAGLMQYNSVRSLAVLPGGDLIAGTGSATPGGEHILRWNGLTWSSIGYFGRNVEALHVLPNGELLAGGPYPGVVRWNGATWSAVGSLVNGEVTTVMAAPNGDVWVGGTFSAASGVVSGGIARLVSSCPATVQTQGVGCAGGTVTSSLPWTGSLWRADASGLPNAALVGVVNGFAQASMPLSAVFATALPGCTLLVQPDYVALTLANAGTASVQFALPNTSALAGTVFHHQMVPLALDSTSAVTATNALRLVVGSF